MKIASWITKDWRKKLVVLGMMVGMVLLAIGWIDLRAEAEAFLKYEKELQRNVTCFPERKPEDRGV